MYPVVLLSIVAHISKSKTENSTLVRENRKKSLNFRKKSDVRTNSKFSSSIKVLFDLFFSTPSIKSLLPSFSMVVNQATKDFVKAQCAKVPAGEYKLTKLQMKACVKELRTQHPERDTIFQKQLDATQAWPFRIRKLIEVSVASLKDFLGTLSNLLSKF